MRLDRAIPLEVALHTIDVEEFDQSRGFAGHDRVDLVVRLGQRIGAGEGADQAGLRRAQSEAPLVGIGARRVDLAVGLPRLAVDLADCCDRHRAALPRRVGDAVEGIADGEAGLLIDIVQLGIMHRDVVAEWRPHEVLHEAGHVHVLVGGVDQGGRLDRDVDVDLEPFDHKRGELDRACEQLEQRDPKAQALGRHPLHVVGEIVLRAREIIERDGRAEAEADGHGAVHVGLEVDRLAQKLLGLGAAPALEQRRIERDQRRNRQDQNDDGEKAQAGEDERKTEALHVPRAPDTRQAGWDLSLVQCEDRAYPHTRPLHGARLLPTL